MIPAHATPAVEQIVTFRDTPGGIVEIRYSPTSFAPSMNMFDFGPGTFEIGSFPRGGRSDGRRPPAEIAKIRPGPDINRIVAALIYGGQAVRINLESGRPG